MQNFLLTLTNRAMRKRVFGACNDSAGPDQTARMRSLISAFAVQKQKNSTECFNGEQMPRRDFTHEQDDVNPHILRMREGTFPLEAAQLILACVRTTSLILCNWYLFRLFTVLWKTGYREYPAGLGESVGCATDW